VQVQVRVNEACSLHTAVEFHTKNWPDPSRHIIHVWRVRLCLRAQIKSRSTLTKPHSVRAHTLRDSKTLSNCEGMQGRIILYKN